jgi:PilZ domain-containing protein
MKGVPAASTPSEPAMAKIRIPFIQKAKVAGEGLDEDQFLIDLGVSGAFVERSEALPVGTRLVLEFVLPGNEIPVRVQCRVAWWHARGDPLVSKVLPAGLGLEFLTVSEDDALRLRRFVLGYLGGGGLRRFHRLRPLIEEEDGARR